MKQPVIWKKRILVPFWVVRICLMLFIIAIYAVALNAIRNSFNDEVSFPAVGVVVVFMLLIIIVLLLDVLAIVLFLRDALNPKTFLIMNCFQTGFWAGVLLMDLIYIARDNSNAAGIGFTVFVFLTFVALLIYASVGYHRQKKQAQRGNYAPAHNPAAPAPANVPSPYHAAPPYQQNTAYHSPSDVHNDPNSHYLPPYQSNGAAADYYTQPAKPAQMV